MIDERMDVRMRQECGWLLCWKVGLSVTGVIGKGAGKGSVSLSVSN